MWSLPWSRKRHIPMHDTIPVLTVADLVAEAERLRHLRTLGMQEGTAFLTLLPGEAEWLALAYLDGEGDSHAWVARHPPLIVGLLEAYPEIRAVYPTQPLRLVRPRYSNDQDDEETEEMDVLDETYEAKTPEVMVVQEWFPEALPPTPDKHLPGGIWLFAEEEDCGPIGKMMHAEADRLNNVLGEQAHWRAEWWWSRKGDKGGWVVMFTPYGEIDLVLSDLISNPELDKMIDQEGEAIEQPPRMVEIPGEEEPLVYQPGDRDWLELLLNERMRRESLGIFYTPQYLSPPMSPEEERHYQRVVDVIGNEDTDPVLRASFEAEEERLHAERLRFLRHLRDERRALKVL